MTDWSSEQPVLAVNGMERAVPMLGPATTLAQAAASFGHSAVDLLPVMEGEGLVGALSLRDLVVEGCGRGRDPATTPVRNLMDAEPLAFSSETGAAEALNMHARDATAALIVKGPGELAGVVSVHGLHRLLGSPPDGPTPEYVRRVRGEQP